ncbi:hypothetical protein K1T71_000884 [Dendrolimus kikuchii]|uniref:Uncharacterized protein n=1 Tax=Dendrolimus kikuchii TaxID=765133 RepID=A0ACC1DGZ8_9NEOP|nr:hypothetical protein K1T71_000884 [Dendrolimus kikuchii]
MLPLTKFKFYTIKKVTMEGDSSTETLRTLAPNWTLAGDDQLLNILQNTHQRIITKCQEVNSKLSEMSTALDDAGISLQNVNNKFMALSNSQFIESRVYDDDDVTTEDIPAQDLPSPKVESELSMLKRSIAVLESMHESVTILRDSDTETDSEDEEISRTVLKPKDVYSSRPLPHIIGSQLWKNKWHAGLLPEDSDSDSTTSKRESRELDEYSESDQEIESNVQTDTLRVPDRTVSETSSEPASEQDILPPAPKQTPSDIAAELARRLGGQPPKMIESTPDIAPPKTPVRKVYKPEQPVTGRVFLDEPPPMDDYMSESSSDTGDIFAELHKKPHEVKKNADMNPAEDLFGFDREDDYTGGDIFRDFAKDKVTSNQGTTQKSSLFDNEPESSLFTEKRDNKQQNVKRREDNESGTSGVKKPVGGVSVFGNNKREIGAAVLRRQRKSSSSSEANSEKIGEGDSSVSKNDVFDDLFDKSKRSEKGKNDNMSKLAEKVPKGVIDEIFERNKQKGAMKKVEASTKSNVLTDLFEKSTKSTSVIKQQITDKKDTKITEKLKVDLFNDNLFDDIDDIFTTNVVKIPKKDDKQHKSLFDDEDDLFADIATATKENVKTDVKVDKVIFESDDDLFTDRPQIKGSNKVSDIEGKPHTDDETKEIGSIASESKKIDRSIFDSDDELFSEKTNVSNISKAIVNQKLPILDNKTKELTPSASEGVIRNTNNNKVIFDSDDELFNKMPNASIDSKSIQNTDKSKLIVRETKEITSVISSSTVNKTIFDSDDELFTSKSGALKANISEDSNVNQNSMQSETKYIDLNVNKEIDNKKISNTKKSIFDSDSDSDIFSSKKVVPKVNEGISETLNEPKQILESNTSLNPQTLIANATDKLSNMRSPSLFDDDDEELFTTKDKIRNIVMNKDDTNKNVIHQISDSDSMQSHVENIKVINNAENRDKESTQVNLDVKRDNDNNEETKLKIDIYENVDESVIPIENTSNVPNESHANKKLELTKANNLLQSDVKMNSTNTINAANATSTINKKYILDSNSKDMDNSVFNAKQIENIPDFEEAKQFEPNNVPAEVDPNKIKDILYISNGEFIDQTSKATTTENVEYNEQNSNWCEQNKNSPTADVEPKVFKDIFNEPPNFSKSIVSQTKEIIEKPDIFSDIFTEPPIFEKPKEPKKSKNVNALFDDDSDDEALFFKKSDVVDDVPHDFSPDIKKDNLFGLFHDEPPAIDVDFITKSSDTVTSKVQNNKSIFTTSEDPINNNNISSDVKLGNKEIKKADITQSAQELQINDDSKDAKSELFTPDDNIPKLGDKISINIHDLFSKDSNSKTDQQSVESFGESSKISDVEKPNTGNLVKTHVNKTSSIFGDQSDDEIFKSANDDNKKKIIVQEDEIDNLFIAKNKKPHFDTDKSFDDIFKTSEHEILIKETKITHGSQPNNNIYKEVDDTKKKQETIKSTLIKDSNITEYSGAEGSKSSENISKLKEVSLIRNADIIKSNSDVDISGSSKIGKLKAKINIDVSRLLPGASPKKKIDKPKSPDQENSSPISVIPTPFSNKNTNAAKVDKETIKQEMIKPVSNEANKGFVAPPSNNEDKSENSDQKSTKTISFDEQSAILDNTLSKERAKIQVKRRPSTRRARREAVRKSTIDNDSTDNSSSIDDQPKSLDVDLPLGYENQDLPSDTKNKDTSDILQTETHTANQTKQDDNNINTKDIQDIKQSKISTDKEKDQEYFESEADKCNKNITSIIVDNKESILVKELQNAQENFLRQGDKSNRNVTTKIVDNKESILKADKENDEECFDKNADKSYKNITSTIVDKKETILTTKKENDQDNFHRQGDKSKNVTSKIVYVLNDEDIFNTKAETSVLGKGKFESKFTESIKPIATLGNAYKNKINITENVVKNNNSKPKASLFGESSDEDKLFGKGKNRKTFSTKVLFDSDSDDDLFVGNKERKEIKDDFRKRVPIVKGSLFGEDDDGDDLFGNKRKKSDKTLSSRPSTSRETNKPSEPVFQDPLSMLGNDD